MSKGVRFAPTAQYRVFATNNVAPQQALFGQPQTQGGFGNSGAFGSAAPPSNTGLFGGASNRVAFGGPPNSTSPIYGASTTPPPLRHVPGGDGFESRPFGEPAPESHSADEEDSFERIGEPATLLEPTTVVSESPLAISYAVEGKSTIPSDGVSHQASIAVLPFESKVTHVTVPRVQPNVYLQVSRAPKLLHPLIMVCPSAKSRIRVNTVFSPDRSRSFSMTASSPRRPSR
jgi:hypothetical protein